MFTAGGPFEQCMLARGWVFDHVIPDPPSAHVRNSSSDHTPPIEVQSNDDWVRRQLDQDNIQQMINQQNLNNAHQMDTDQFNQQQQMINNNRLSDKLTARHSGARLRSAIADLRCKPRGATGNDGVPMTASDSIFQTAPLCGAGRRGI
jgi:hypothetical protein